MFTTSNAICPITAYQIDPAVNGVSMVNRQITVDLTKGLAFNIVVKISGLGGTHTTVSK